MDLPFELFVALRYLLARRKQAFISLISLISVLGVAVGVMALVIALALMTGLQGELRDRILGSTPHVYVFKVGGSTTTDGRRQTPARDPARRSAPRRSLLGQGADLRPGRGRVHLQSKASTRRSSRRSPTSSASMQVGKPRRAGAAPTDGPAGILLGTDLAAKLGVAVGDVVRSSTAAGSAVADGHDAARGAFKVAGIFNLGLYEFDSAYGFVQLDVAKRCSTRTRRPTSSCGSTICSRRRRSPTRFRRSSATDYVAQDWADMNKSLFSALWLEKMAISITIGLIVMVAALNIVASLILLVMEKSRDIAILKTMGSSRRVSGGSSCCRG